MQKTEQGRNCLNGPAVHRLMAACGMHAPLLVAGERMAGVFRERTGMKVPVFSAFHPNPDLADARAGMEQYRAWGCDGLISIGGGSAMDTAKAVKAMLIAPDMDAVMRSDLPEGASVPHLAIPATAGTGAEATPIAVTYVDGQKLSLDHPALLPEAVLLDGSLLDTLPLYHKKACAMDALCQGIESYWAVHATGESRIHAERAIRGVLANFDRYIQGDKDVQDDMLLAAYESGCAIRISRTTAAHAMSYQITKRIGYAHGHACMLTLPYLWRHLLQSGAQDALLHELAAIIGAAPEDVPALLTGLLKDADMLPTAPVDDALLDALASSVNVQRLGNHPEKLKVEELRAIYREALC